jgi:hypothetical protein
MYWQNFTERGKYMLGISKIAKVEDQAFVIHDYIQYI